MLVEGNRESRIDVRTTTASNKFEADTPASDRRGATQPMDKQVAS